MGDTPRSFSGVVQLHVRKGVEKMSEEQSILVKFKIMSGDDNLRD